MNQKFRSLLKLMSSVVLIGLLYAVYAIWHQYDWGYPIIKAAGFIFVFGLILFLRRAPKVTALSGIFAKLEIAVAAIVLLSCFFFYGKIYGPYLTAPPYVDVGYTTVNAAAMVVNEHSNPYSSPNINPRPELQPAYRGFHYGPMMLAAYFPGVFFQEGGFKAASLFYLASSIALMFLLASRAGQSRTERLASWFFILATFFLAERFWFEILAQGANDIFPIALILASLLMLKKEHWLAAGLFAGLSSSAKFAPAGVLLILFIRKSGSRRLWQGVALGLLPLLAFSLWDPVGLFNNVFFIRFTLNYDSTSLYSVVPPWLHFIFPLTLAIAVVVALYRNFRAKLEYKSVLVAFTLLAIIVEIMFKEVHANHLIWFYPLFSLILEAHRYQLFSVFLRDKES